MIPFLSGYHISFSYFFALKVVRDPHYCVKLKIFPAPFHIFGQMDKMKQPHGRMSTKWAPHDRGASNVIGASQWVSPLPNLHNLQSIT